MNTNNNTNESQSHSPQQSRRKLLGLFTLTSCSAVMLPRKWVKPSLDSIITPAHAQTSGDVGDTDVETEPEELSFSLEEPPEVLFVADDPAPQTVTVSGVIKKDTETPFDFSTAEVAVEVTSLKAEEAGVAEVTLKAERVAVKSDRSFTAKIAEVVTQATSVDKKVTKSVTKAGYKIDLSSAIKDYAVASQVATVVKREAIKEEVIKQKVSIK